MLESLSRCATRFIGIVDVDTYHNKNDGSRGSNGKLPDVRDDVSKESGKTELNESANEGNETGVASTVTIWLQRSHRIHCW